MRIAEAANYLGVHPTTLRRWEREGKVRVYRLPSGERRYDRADLDEIVKVAS